MLYKVWKIWSDAEDKFKNARWEIKPENIFPLENFPMGNVVNTANLGTKYESIWKSV